MVEGAGEGKWVGISVQIFFNEKHVDCDDIGFYPKIGGTGGERGLGEPELALGIKINTTEEINVQKGRHSKSHVRITMFAFRFYWRLKVLFSKPYFDNDGASDPNVSNINSRNVYFGRRIFVVRSEAQIFDFWGWWSCGGGL